MNSKIFQRAFALAMSASLTLPCLVFAAPAPPPASGAAGGATNLNLGSTTHSQSSGLTGAQTAVIRVGNVTMPVNASSSLTPAQTAALLQVISTGHQALNLNNLGAAVSGTVSLNNGIGQNLSSLVIPAGVSLTSNGAVLNVSGDVVNSGVLAFVSQPTGVVNSLFATNVINNFGALLTSPTSFYIGASQNLVNAGRIVSGQDVSLNFGKALTNTGLIASTYGNINLNSPGNILVTNQGGSFQALNGGINVRDSHYLGAASTTLLGGEWLSNSLNILGGKDAVNVNVGNVSGVINITACSAHVNANSTNLQIGAMNISGDPTYFNTGDITLTNSVDTGGNPLAIVAGGNILAGTTAVTIKTEGSPLLMLAGASFTISPNTAPLTATTGGAGDTTTSLAVLGSSTTGGRIDFTPNTTSTPISIDTSASTGGSITMVAFAGTSKNSGTINLTSGTGGSAPATLNSSGAGANNNGDVTLIADTQSGTGITMGAVTASGTGNFGSIVAAVAKPIVTPGFTVLNGNYSGGIAVGSIENGSIVVPAAAALSTQFGAVILRAGGDIAVKSNITTGGFIPVVQTTPPANSVDIYNFGSVLGIRNGGSITAIAGGQIGFPAAVTLNASSSGAGQDGGAITLAGASISIPSASGVSLQANSVNGFTTPSNTFYGGNGGSVSITSTSAAKGVAPISIGNGTGNFQISAQGSAGGGNGGSLYVSSGTNINIDTTTSTNLQLAPQPGSNSEPNTSQPSGTISVVGTGRGANITLVAGTAGTGTVFVNGNLRADGASSSITSAGGNPNGSGGNISISVNAPSAFLVGGASSTTPNGTSGLITANGNTVSGGSIQALGDGGSVAITNLGSGGIVVSNTGANTNTPGATASIEVQSANSFDGNANNTPISAGLGGKIALTAAKGDVLVKGGIDASGGAGSNFNNPGSGGRVEINLNSSNQFNVDTALAASAKSGVHGAITAVGNLLPAGVVPTTPANISTTRAGNGGTVIVNNVNPTGAATGGIRVGANALSITAADANAIKETVGGDGGTVKLIAPAGPVYVNGSLSADGGAANGNAGTGPVAFPFPGENGGDGGTINIVSGSPAVFAIGPSSKNGVNGNLSAQGYNGGTVSVSSNGAGGISVASAATNINVQTTAVAINNSNLAGGNGGNVVLNAQAGPVSVTGALDVGGSSGSTTGSNPSFNNGGNGGTISITSNSSKPFVISGTGSGTNGISSTLSARGGQGLSTSGNGGTISVVNLGGGVVVGSSGAIDVRSRAGTGPLTAALSQAGNGGNISLQGLKGDVIVVGSLNADGGAAFTNPPAGTSALPPGNGGTITIVTNSSKAFDIGGSEGLTQPGTSGSITANGLAGGTISVSNLGTGGITVESGQLTTTAKAAEPAIFGGSYDAFDGGKGGNITLNSPGGPVLVKGSLSVNGGAGIDSAVGVPAPNTVAAGSFSTVNTSNVQFNMSDTTQFEPGQTVQIVSGSGTILGVVQAVNPGTSVTVFNVATTVSGSASLTAYLPGGNGGQIAIVAAGKSPFLVGGATTNGVVGNLSANGANAGSISVTGLTGLTVTPGNLSLVPTAGTVVTAGGNGGNLHFSAIGTGALLVNAGMSVAGAAAGAGSTFAGGNGGTITLISNSSSPFNINGSTSFTNGVQGMLSAGGNNAGSIGVRNSGSGGISLTPNGAFSLPAIVNGGTIDLQAGFGKITVAASGALFADGGIGNNGNGGKISLAANEIVTATKTGNNLIQLSAVGDVTSGDTGAGGFVSITQTSPTALLTIGRLSKAILISVDGSPVNGVGGTLSATAVSGISVIGNLSTSTTNSGTINLNVLGKGNITNSTGTITSGTLNAITQAGSIGTGPNGNDLNTAVANFSFTTQGGGVYVTNNGDLNILSSSVAATKTPTNVTITNNGSSGGLTVQGTITAPNANVQLTETGTGADGIAILSNVNAGTIALTSTGTSSAGGGITATTGVLNATAPGGITLQAGAAGISSLLTSTGALNVSINGVASGITPNVTITNTGNLFLSVTASKVVDINTLSVTSAGSITTVGGITDANSIVLSCGGGGANAWSIVVGGKLGAANGNVTLGANGSIAQIDPTDIIRAGSVNLNAGNGNIGTPNAPIHVDATNLSSSSFLGTYLNAKSDTQVLQALSGGDYTLTSGGHIIVALNNPATGFNSTNGSITLSTPTGLIQVTATNAITAFGGPVLINAATIQIGDNVTLSGTGRIIDGVPFDSSTGVALYSGTFPANPVAGQTPGGITVNNAGTFNAFFNSSQFSSIGSATVNVSGANVLFSSNNISLGNSVAINGTGQTRMISSLDLSDPAVIAKLSSLQGSNGIGGNLSQKTISFTVPTVSLINLKSFVVPAGYTVTFNGFTTSSPISVIMDNIAKGKNASVAGTVNFTSATNPFVSLDSRLPGQVLTIAGTVSSDANLTLMGSSNILVSGNLAVNGTTVPGVLNVWTGMIPSTSKDTAKLPLGTITLPGKVNVGPAGGFGTLNLVSSGSVLNMTNVSAQRVSVQIGGNNGTLGSSTLTSTGLGALVLVLNAGSGSNVSLTSSKTANVGVVSLSSVGLSPVTITQLDAPLAIQGIAGGTLTVKAPAISVASSLNCGSCVFTTSNFNLGSFIASASDPNGTIAIAPLTISLSITGFDALGAGTISADGGLTIGSKTATLAISQGNLVTNGGLLTVSGKSIAMRGVVLNAGIAGPNYFSGTLSPTDVVRAGTINIAAAGGDIVGSISATTVGGNLLISSAGKTNISLISTLTANGGELQIASGGGAIDVSGSTLTANAVGTAATNCVGGNITISNAGQLLNGVSLLRFAPGTAPTNPLFLQPSGGVGALGDNVQINNDNLGLSIPNGVISVTAAAKTTLNLATNNTATLNTSGGGTLVFNLGAGTSITGEGTIFTTNSYSPVAALDGASVAHMINPSSNMTISTDLASIKAKKGSLFTVTRTADALRVVACGQSGEVSVTVGGVTIGVTSGEEVIVSAHALSAGEQGSPDGVGRRFFRELPHVHGFHVYSCEVSLVSLLGVPELAAVKYPATSVERRAAARLLRTAAAVSVVTNGHGPYIAQTRRKTANAMYKAVSYSNGVR